jgi:hypothetical protein
MASGKEQSGDPDCSTTTATSILHTTPLGNSSALCTARERERERERDLNIYIYISLYILKWAFGVWIEQNIF